MRRMDSTRTLLLSANIVYFGALILFSTFVGYLAIPLHEGLHSLPCLAYGLSPEIRFSSVTCEGIQNISVLGRFFYYMMPYIWWFVFLIAMWFLHKKVRVLKYFLLVPFMDVIMNYIGALRESDFKFLAQHTSPNLIPFGVSMILVMVVVLLTLTLIEKTRIYHFSVLKEDFNIDIEKKLVATLRKRNNRQRN